MDRYAIDDTTGKWVEYRFDDVIQKINEIAGNPNLEKIQELSSHVKEIFDESQSSILSLLSTLIEKRQDDKYLKNIVEKIEKMKLFSVDDFIKALVPTGQQMSRDAVAIQTGLICPPHLRILSEINAISYPFSACSELSTLSRKIASHIQNIEKHTIESERIGTNVFIGHGHSSIWKDLKDFIQDRIHLPWDEFNRVPIAGFTNIARLSQMLDEAAIAFLIMTAEDEQIDGKQYARQNVIHESGLFQGRLGFERAIILLEEGCEEFSNITGLGQIRFPQGNISAVFEDIRRVLEREGLIDEQ